MLLVADSVTHIPELEKVSWEVDGWIQTVCAFRTEIFIYKFAGVFVIRNLPRELNSYYSH